MGAVLGLAVLVALLGFILRGVLRQQILSRDAVVFESVANLRGADVDEASASLFPIDGALAASELRGVLGLIVTDAEGALVARVPTDLFLETIPRADRERASASGAFGRFHPSLPLDLLFFDHFGTEEAPFVELVVVLEGTDVGSVHFAQYWVDGSAIRAEFASLDRTLIWQGLLAWIAATVALGVVFAIAYLRLRQSGRALDARNRELEKKNRELELAARTAAVGSISAHLLHGLKSPLAGLRAYLRAHGDGEALETAGRMQQLVHETLRVLREDARQSDRSVPLGELIEDLRAKLAPLLEADKRELRADALPPLAISRRHANLLRLVLENLIANSLEAAEGPAQVEVAAEVTSDRLHLRVSDQSGGISETVQARLFQPGVTSKPEGSGLGLAISRQLLVSLQGSLELVHSDAHGSTFQIELPREAIDAPASTANTPLHEN